MLRTYSVSCLSGGLVLKEHSELTSTLHVHVNARTHDLVPPIYHPNPPPRVRPVLNPAERVRECGIWDKVFLNRVVLLGWAGLRQGVNDARNI